MPNESKVTLELKLDIFLDGIDDHQVICNIYHSTDYKNDERDIILYLREPKYIDLVPGDYIVEVMLPSGKSLTRNITIPDEPKMLDIKIRGESSPHEWLSWQQYVGNIDRDEYKTLKKEAEGFIPYQQRYSITSKLIVTDICPIMFDSNDKSKRESDLYAIIKHDWDPYIIEIHPQTYDEISALHSFYPGYEDGLYDHNQRRLSDFKDQYRTKWNDWYNSRGFDWYDYEGKYSTRQYFAVRGDEIADQFCVLPSPWFGSRTMSEVDIEVLFSIKQLETSKLTFDHYISVIVKDSLFSTVLGYLQSGNEPIAAKMLLEKENLEIVINMLRDKRKNPFAAAAGGYILLNHFSDSKFDEYDRRDPQFAWLSWIENLMNWFPWLPDGAILHAWGLILYGEREPVGENAEVGFSGNYLSNETRDNVRKALLTGYHRGLPFYSRGVKLLLDGLRMFVNEAKKDDHPDVELEKAFNDVWKLSTRINPNHPFTTVIMEEDY